MHRPLQPRPVLVAGPLAPPLKIPYVWPERFAPSAWIVQIVWIAQIVSRCTCSADAPYDVPIGQGRGLMLLREHRTNCEGGNTECIVIAMFGVCWSVLPFHRF